MKKKFSIYASDDDIINNEHKAIKEKKYLQNYQKIYKKYRKYLLFKSYILYI